MPRGKRQPVDLGVIKFEKMVDAREYFHTVLQSYRPGDTVSAEHGAQLAELLKRHPDHAAKVGVGIAHFEVIDADFGSQCFAVRRTDGSFEDFSYKTCISEGRY